VPINDRFEIHGSAIGYAFGSDVLKNYNQVDKSGAFVGSIGFGVKF
jgi:hypothetical protein